MNLKKIIYTATFIGLTYCTQEFDAPPKGGTFRDVSIPSLVEENLEEKQPKTTSKPEVAEIINSILEQDEKQKKIQPPKIEDADRREVVLNRSNIQGTIKDTSGYEYLFTHMQTTPIELNLNYKHHALTIKRDDVYYLFNIRKLVNFKKEREDTHVYTKDGLEITGSLIDNDNLTDFYGHYSDSYIFGINDKKTKKINIANIESIVINDIGKVIKRTMTTTPRTTPKMVIHTDGRMFESNVAYVIDFCGHYWNNHHHLRLKSHFNNISLEKITEIEFTGVFEGQKREAALQLRNGTTSKKFLYLTSESYGGTCNTGDQFGYFDKILLEQDYGAILILLDDVKKVIPIPRQKR